MAPPGNPRLASPPPPKGAPPGHTSRPPMRPVWRPSETVRAPTPESAPLNPNTVEEGRPDWKPGTGEVGPTLGLEDGGGRGKLKCNLVTSSSPELSVGIPFPGPFRPAPNSGPVGPPCGAPVPPPDGAPTVRPTWPATEVGACDAPRSARERPRLRLASDIPGPWVWSWTLGWSWPLPRALGWASVWLLLGAWPRALVWASVEKSDFAPAQGGQGARARPCPGKGEGAVVEAGEAAGVPGAAWGAEPSRWGRARWEAWVPWGPEGMEGIV